MRRSNCRRPVLAVVQLSTLAVIAFLTVGPSAQGLGDVARKETERRQKVAEGKRYTNEDLSANSSPTSAAPVAGKEAPTAEKQKDKTNSSAEAGASEAAKSSTPEETPQRDSRPESYWRERAREIRASLLQQREQVRALEGRLSGFDSQPASPAVAGERDITLKVLSRAQKNVASLEGEWSRFEGKARAAKIPPDWIR